MKGEGERERERKKEEVFICIIINFVFLFLNIFYQEVLDGSVVKMRVLMCKIKITFF